ncbi:YebC/PmpR family DNA-binding transcriptional regulator [bacterium]|jgi:YebC/PmpR family DNA-binding regulatory protein|nr:YebC/PmpR family DNA-binding transcriptional regulator [bacterium]
MSGHSKWSTIKHKKAKTDHQRGKQFSKVSKEIIMAAKIGGGDPEMNPRLRLAIQKAKSVNMPNDNVKRAIQRGVGGGDDSNYEEVMFEGYGPNGVGLIIETLTDNKNRTVPNLKHALSKNGGSLATKGAVSYMFSKKGLFIFSPESPDEKIMEVASDAGADDIDIKDDGSIEVLCEFGSFEAVRVAFESNELVAENASIEMIPENTVQLTAEQVEKIEKLIEALEEDDDVQDVYSNYEAPEE